MDASQHDCKLRAESPPPNTGVGTRVAGDADGAGATTGAAGAGGDAGSGRTNRVGDPQQLAHATPLVAGDAYGGDAPLDDLLGVLGLE